jgi:hypothetical protein
MFVSKSKHPSVKIKDAASQSEIISFTTPHAGGLCDKYEYSASDKAHHIRERLNCSMLSILVLLFLLSVTTYTVILGLRYVVVRNFSYRLRQIILENKKIANFHV